MNAFLPQLPSAKPMKGWHAARWVLGLVVMLSAVAALAGYLTLTQPSATALQAPATTATAATVATGVTHGAPLLHDHSVVLRQNLPDEPEIPGVSIAAYASP